MTKRVDEILRLEHDAGSAQIGRLSPQDRTALRRVVRDRSQDRRNRALGLYARTGASDVFDVLSGVLRDRREQPALRQAAATLLGVQAQASAEELLLRALSTERDPDVTLRIARSLGRIGTGRSLGTLDRACRGSAGAVRKQIDFARLLIGHREGDARLRVRAPRPSALLTARGRLARFDVSRVSRPLATKAIQSLEGDRYGLSLDTGQAFNIDCGRRCLLLVLGKAASLDAVAEAATGRPSLIGLLLARAEVDGTYAVSRALLAGPAGRGGAYLALYRVDGQMSSHGELRRMARRSRSFEMRAVRHAGNAAVRIRGSLGGGRLVFTDTASATEVLPGSRPKPLRI